MSVSILYVTPWLQHGGIERALETEAPWLTRRGHRVAVASWFISERLSWQPNPVLDTLAYAGIRVHRVPARGRLQLAQRAIVVAALALRHRAQVVVGQELLGAVVTLLAGVLTGGRFRTIVEVHTASSTYIETVKSRALIGIARRLYRSAGGIRAVSESVARDAAEFFRLPRPKISTIYNAFDLDRIQRLAAGASLPLGDIGPYILACGRLVKLKGFADLIDAFSSVRAKHAVKLVILGDGPERAYLLEHARQRGVAGDVVLPGFVANPFPYFARAVAFVMTSRYGESFSRVLVEAMASGTPVIASRCRWGPEEILDGGRYGRLYDIGDVAGLATHIRELLDDPGVAIPLVAAARRRAGDFAVGHVLPKLERLCLGVVDSDDLTACSSGRVAPAPSQSPLVG